MSLRVHNRFNPKMKAIPIGTKVTVTMDSGTLLETETTSDPWELCGTWVVLVRGIRGGYALSRVHLRVTA